MGCMPTQDQIREALRAVIDPELRRDIVELGMVRSIDAHANGVVDVAGERLAARRAVVVATGSSAKIPPVTGLAETRPWTNVEGTTAKQVPGRLFVLGGGVVGVELAQAWSGLGSQVTLDHRDILAEIVQNRLGNPNVSAVFPDYVPTMRGVTK